MNCTVVYGFGRNKKHSLSLPVPDAFRKLSNHYFTGYTFVDIYYNHELVYTTQSTSGYRYICNDCPYKTKGE